MSDSRPRLYTWQECRDLPVREVQQLYRDHVNPGQVDLIGSFGFGRITAVRAEGMYIETTDGRRILDFTGGIGVLSHGHNHPEILAARRAYAEAKSPEVHKNFLSQYIAGLSHNIAQLLPGDLDISYFCNSGAEAVEGAVKMAYKYHDGRRGSIAHADIAFHGKLLGSAGLTGSPELRFAFPTIPNIRRFAYDDIESVEKLVAACRTENGECDLYAIILEPLNASSLRECSPEFLRELRRLCDQERIVLIFDEVYTSWSKTGALFYFMHEGISPDIVTYAKSFGGGKASISGYTARKPIFTQAYGKLQDAILHSTTYNGFGEETITAMEAIRIVVEDDFVGRAQRIHQRLQPGLLRLQEKHPGLISEVRGRGALQGVILDPELGKPIQTVLNMVPMDLFKDPRFGAKLLTSSVISELFNRHEILSFYGDNREIPLLVSPSLIVQDEEIDRFLEALDATLSLGKTKLLVKFAMQKWG